MSIQEIVSMLTNSGIAHDEANIEVKMLIEHFCGYSVKDIIMGRKLDDSKLNIVRQKVEQRVRTQMPIQYIIGKAYFMGDYYKVNKDVLIPRDETELVVRKALHLIKNNDYKDVLDIGTGSGCIACTIAKRTNCSIDAIDISESALKIARDNAVSLKLTSIDFYKSDLYSNIKGKKFDLIVSNPPYIPYGTKLQNEVGFEPSVALFASGNQGTQFYEEILSKANEYLNPNGAVIFELGINQAEIIKEYFIKYGFIDIALFDDLAKIPRVIYGFTSH